MLRCLGWNFHQISHVLLRFLMKMSVWFRILRTLLLIFSKKHVAISYHVMREAVAAGIISPYWISGGFNMSDILTKKIPKPEFKGQCDHIFWQPDFHLLDHNRLDQASDKPDTN